MKLNLKWNGNMQFLSESGKNQTLMDAKSPIGQDTAMTPKELVGAGLAGCSAMDVIALFKKHKQNVESFTVDVDIQMSTGGYPSVFTEALLIYKAAGPIDPEVFKEAVVSSQTKYCGVSAMLSQTFPIKYKVILNEALLLEGQAHFEKK